METDSYTFGPGTTDWAGTAASLEGMGVFQGQDGGSSSSPVSEYTPYSLGFQAPLTALLMLELVLGFSSNLTVLVLYCSQSNLVDSVSNMVTVNLHVLDVAVCLLCLPLTLVVVLLEPGPNLAVLCCFHEACVTFASIATAVNILVISLDRYDISVRPANRLLTTRRASLLLAAVWVTSVAVFFIPFLELQWTSGEGDNGQWTPFSLSHDRELRTWRNQTLLCIGAHRLSRQPEYAVPSHPADTGLLHHRFGHAVHLLQNTESFKHPNRLPHEKEASASGVPPVRASTSYRRRNPGSARTSVGRRVWSSAPRMSPSSSATRRSPPPPPRQLPPPLCCPPPPHWLHLIRALQGTCPPPWGSKPPCRPLLPSGGRCGATGTDGSVRDEYSRCPSSSSPPSLAAGPPLSVTNVLILGVGPSSALISVRLWFLALAYGTTISHPLLYAFTRQKLRTCPQGQGQKKGGLTAPSGPFTRGDHHPQLLGGEPKNQPAGAPGSE
ncbi:hypothetical protein fugu_004831 [Takifugu bimaculatus]|uniref:G-protein coupled receptors family 1 profile domain-containing protein n=1 Tax=Takifugu bimaculatus TaxID=433685 RepID=A0A4Z2B997_9TELE|nr:hypothetical protein fugu_004831 [Takifugu bimaculatus]